MCEGRVCGEGVWGGEGVYEGKVCGYIETYIHTVYIKCEQHLNHIIIYYNIIYCNLIQQCASFLWVAFGFVQQEREESTVKLLFLAAT